MIYIGGLYLMCTGYYPCTSAVGTLFADECGCAGDLHITAVLEKDEKEWLVLQQERFTSSERDDLVMRSIDRKEVL